MTTNILLAGKVFNDVNSNGVQDAGEAVMPGVVVNIISNGSIIVSRTTDANGRWQVRGLSAGSGEADVVIPGGFTATSPVGGKYVGSMTAGQANQNLNFGLHQTSPAPILATATGSILHAFDDSLAEDILMLE